MQSLTLNISDNPDVYLRQISLEDIQPLYDLIIDSREHLKAYQPWALEATFESTAERVKFNLKRIADNEFRQFRIVCRKETKYSGIVGTVTFHNKQQNLPATLMGYWVGKNAEGKGYAYAACKRAIEYVFDDWGMEYVILEIDPDNIRSEKLAVRLGAVDQGVLSQLDGDGQEFKSKVWTVTK